jgi:hypothetical protein
VRPKSARETQFDFTQSRQRYPERNYAFLAFRKRVAKMCRADEIENRAIAWPNMDLFTTALAKWSA